jgi:exodeoxyribonuclease VII large subunit
LHFEFAARPQDPVFKSRGRRSSDRQPDSGYEFSSRCGRDTLHPVAFADQLGLSFKAPERRIWVVRDLMAAIRTHLEREYTDLWVEGEISNFRAHDSSGHLYFTLKDHDSQIKAVMFRSQARLLRFRPDNGMHVLLRGRVTVFENRGDLQLSVEHLEPKGAGALQIAFEQLKAKLQAEGLFDPARKKPIPALPRRIGVVTSPQAAALRDILNILRRRHQAANVLIFPAQVQGETAAKEVMTGVRYFNRTRSVDVIIVARGGGSQEDLAAFNDEALARTVADSEIPVISAVGHETDFTILDFVAALRAATPSAAAELVIRSRQELEDQMTALNKRLAHGIRYRLLVARQLLTETTQQGAFARLMDGINQRQQRVDDLTFRLEKSERRLIEQLRRRWERTSAAVRHYDARRVLAGIKRDLVSHTATLAANMRTVFMRNRSVLDQMERQLKALSPIAILERGYALVFDSSGNLVKDSTQVNAGDEISAKLARGQVRARIEKTD